MKESGSARMLPFGVSACLAMTDSMSEVSRTGAVIASTARDEAAVLIGFKKNSAAYGAVSGLNKTATRATRGAISFKSCSHFVGIVGSMLVKPVTLPPGSGKLATKPLPTGSETLTNTIGIVRVCCSSAAVVGVISENRRSGCSSTSSFADRCIDRKSSGIGQRILIRMLRPSAQLSSWRASYLGRRLDALGHDVRL